MFTGANDQDDVCKKEPLQQLQVTKLARSKQLIDDFDCDDVCESELSKKSMVMRIVREKGETKTNNRIADDCDHVTFCCG